MKFKLILLLLLVCLISFSSAWWRRRRRRRCSRVDCQWGSWSNYGSCSARCGGGRQSRSRSVARGASCGGSGCSGSSTSTRSCNTQCCPVNCVWGSWRSYGSCSTTCGGGRQTRSRSYRVSPRCGGRCSGSSSSSRSCNTQCCPVNCRWGSWGSYSTCSARCGGGTQRRSRSLVTSVRCGGSCSGSSSSSRSCNTQCCPVNCRWGSWGSYGTCSARCGGGTQKRSRSLVTSVRCGGSCSGSSSSSRSCNTQCCPVNCRWGSWGSYSTCSARCGGGTQRRSRSLVTSVRCGGSCSGSSSSSRSCNTQCCSVNCRWAAWGSYGSCSARCGGGTQRRSRSIATSARCGGSNCSGDSTSSRSCNSQCCPVNCVWGSWGSYGTCSATCGGGTQARSRSAALKDSCGGSKCTGQGQESRNCNTRCCPVNCRWGSWGSYGTCSATCGGGKMERSRTIQTAAKCGGVDCVGEDTETETCNDQNCRIDCSWSEWTAWEECPVTCGGGLQSRKRSIDVSAQHGGKRCSGSDNDTRACNNDCCPVDCEFSQWSKWESCSKTCGDGSQSRQRRIAIEASCGGSICIGETVEAQDCNIKCCPVNCEITQWTEWSNCSSSCGPNGIKTRSRSITVSPQCNGSICPESFNEEKPCNRICHNEGLLNGSQCQCDLRWSGECCEKDNNECESNLNDCDPEALCSNTDGSYTCTCKEGYSGNGKECQNVDECSTYQHNCHFLATCLDTSGGYTCNCLRGFIGNGTDCKDVNECENGENDCDENAFCFNAQGSYFCS